MKKLIAALCLMLALAASAAAEYVPIGVTQELRYEINFFLTNFSEQGMQAFNRERASDAQMIEFAVRHIRLNRRDLIEHGSWSGGTLRVSREHIEERTLRYLGLVPWRGAAGDWRYADGYCYFSEGSDIRMGFACMSAVENLENDRIGVYFGVFASGDNWNTEDFKLRPEQAARKYPDSQVGCGYAVIDLSSGDWSSREGWTLAVYDTLL